jgi:hypothetical protein
MARPEHGGGSRRQPNPSLRGITSLVVPPNRLRRRALRPTQVVALGKTATPPAMVGNRKGFFVRPMAVGRISTLSLCCALTLVACAVGPSSDTAGSNEGSLREDSSSSGTSTSTAATTSAQALPPSIGWELLPASPLTARTSALGVWTGDEVLVIGGEPEAWCPPNAECIPPDFLPLADGAVFDPVTGSWRMITEAPFPFSNNASAVVVGDAVYVLVHEIPRPGASGGFLRYLVSEDRWERLPSPSPAADRYHLVGTSASVAAFPHSDEAGETPDLLFDPATGSWHQLPSDPLSPSFDRSMVSIDGDLYLFAQNLVPNPGSENPPLVRAARLDLAAGTWEVLADSEILASWSPVAIGSSIVFPNAGSADGGEVNNWGRSYPYGGIYHIDTDSWSWFREAPQEIAGVVGDANAAYMSAHGEVLEIGSESWITIPELSITEGEIYNQTIVAAGRDLFVFGGETWTDKGGMVLRGAYRWQPTAGS